MRDQAQVRLMVEEDLPDVLAWRNDPAVRAVMFTRHVITPEEHRAWFERTRREAGRELLIAEAAGAPIGFVQFSAASDAGVSDWGFYAAPGAPKGSGRLLGAAALRHAFESLALHKVCGQALALNEASIRMHRDLGFALEGVLREQHLVEGRRHDLHCFGILRTEWLT